MYKPILLTFLVSVALAGCEKKAALPCLSGTLIASNCQGGYFVQTDSTAQPAIGTSYSITTDTGDPLPGPALKPRLYNNVVTVAGPLLKDLPRGQKFYFQFQPADPQALPPLCPADTTSGWHPFPPNVRLLGVSNSSCSALLPE